MKLPQYNLGKWYGFYYAELQNGLSLVGMINAIVGLTVLWVVSSGFRTLFPWLTYAMFVGVVLIIVLIVLPLVDYIFIYRTRQSFLNEQGYKHNNPFKTDIDLIKEDVIKIKKHLGIDD